MKENRKNREQIHLGEDEMQRITIYGNAYRNPEALHKDLRIRMNLPEYYGCNLDALYDILTELTEETEVELQMEKIRDKTMETYLNRLWRVLEDASEENACLCVKRIG